MKKIIIGFTKSNLPEYSSFDGYQEGAEQHLLEIEVPDFNMSIKDLGDYVFHASNTEPPDPSVPWPPGNLVDQIRDAIIASGYTGREAHYSLSVGDTVECDGERVACAPLGWEVLR